MHNRQTNIMKHLLIIIALICSALSINAQDTIVKKNGTIMNVKVTEVGTEEVKFKTQNSADAPIIVLKKSEIKSLKIGSQIIIEEEKTKEQSQQELSDVLVKKDGSSLKIKVVELGTNEVKFKLSADPDAPLISIAKDDIKSLKVGDQYVIDVKKESEDIIVKKDGSSLKVKVIEMGSNEVKFKLYNTPEGPNMSLSKEEIQSVKINGQIVYEYKEDPYSISNNSILDKTACVKFNFFSPLSNHLAFGYEWMDKPGFNYEGGFGIIGPGVNGINNSVGYGVIAKKPKGVFLRFGPKFLLGNVSDLEVKGGRIAHPLKGRYIKPEIILHTMTTEFSTDTSLYQTGNYVHTKNNYQSIAFHLIYGRQNIYGNALTVGYYIGIGYGFESKSTTGYAGNNYWNYDPRRYSHFYFGENFPMTITWGLNIGWLHKPYEKKGKKSYKNNPRAGV